MSRSPLQEKQFSNARNKRWIAQQSTGPPTQSFDINPRRYVLATLTEGLSETTARRFLAKLNISPPSKDAFYKEQKYISDIVERLSEESMAQVRANLPKDAIFGIDCSWSGRRNATHAIVIFMEMRSRLIFDKVIISREESVSDFAYNGPSNLMENAAVRAKRDKYVADYHFIGFVHDFDIDTAPILHPDSITGQLVEFLDPGHLKKNIRKFIYVLN